MCICVRSGLRSLVVEGFFKFLAVWGVSKGRGWSVIFRDRIVVGEFPLNVEFCWYGVFSLTVASGTCVTSPPTRSSLVEVGDTRVTASDVCGICEERGGRVLSPWEWCGVRIKGAVATELESVVEFESQCGIGVGRAGESGLTGK